LQFDVFKEISEILEQRLKIGLSAVLAYTGHLTSRAKADNKPSHMLQLELDSAVSKILFQLKINMLRGYQSCFSQFEEGLLASISKFCNLSEDKLAEFSLEKAIQSLVQAKKKNQKVEKTPVYENFQKFLLDIPSRPCVIRVRAVRRISKHPIQK